MVKMPTLTKPEYDVDKNKLAIRTSDRDTFKKCRRQWDYASPLRMNLEPDRLNEHFVFGTAFHAAMEIKYDPDRSKYPGVGLKQLAISKFIEEMEPLRKTEIEFGLLKMSFDDYVELGIGMINYYWDYADEHDKNLKSVLVEDEFEIVIGAMTEVYATSAERFGAQDGELVQRFVPYPGKWNDSVEKRQEWFDNGGYEVVVVYQGRIDLLFQDLLNNGYRVVDHKTAGTLSETFYLELDTQVSSYAWAYVVLGYDVRGVIYNECVKNFPKPPKVLKKGDLSVDKQQAVTAESWLAGLDMTVAEYKVNGGTGIQKYDDFVDWLLENPREFVRRTPLTRNKQMLKIQYDYILAEAAEMLNDPSIYPTPNKMVCNYCPFRAPCLAANEGGDPDIMLEFGGYQPRKPRHWR